MLALEKMAMTAVKSVLGEPEIMGLECVCGEKNIHIYTYDSKFYVGCPSCKCGCGGLGDKNLAVDLFVQFIESI